MLKYTVDAHRSSMSPEKKNCLNLRRGLAYNSVKKAQIFVLTEFES